MSSFSFLHAADLHLDSPLRGLSAYEGAPTEELRGATRRALEALVDLAIDEPVAFLLISGDIYDGDWRDFNTGLFFVRQMARLHEAGIPTFAIAGNHDAESRMTRSLPLPSSFRMLSTRSPETVRLEGVGVAVHGQGFSTPAVTDDLSRGYPPPEPGLFNIGLLHTSADGRADHEPYAPCSVDRLVTHGYDYWALGHVHGREVLHEDPWVVFPGNLQGRHVRESGPKGATLVNVQDGQIVAVERRDLDVVRWSSVIVDASNLSTAEEVGAKSIAALRDAVAGADGRLLAARVLLDGATPAHAEIVCAPEQFVADLHALALTALGEHLWIEQVRLGTRLPVDTTLLRDRDDPLGEMLRTVRDLDADVLQTFARDLEPLKSRLPAEVSLDPTDPDVLRAALDDVEQFLLAHLGAADPAPNVARTAH